MTKCTFCGKEEQPHRGINFIKNTGTVNYFCSSKCLKNATKLKRDKRKVRWTEAFHLTRDKARERIKEAEAKVEVKTQAKKIK